MKLVCVRGLRAMGVCLARRCSRIAGLLASNGSRVSQLTCMCPHPIDPSAARSYDLEEDVLERCSAAPVRRQRFVTNVICMHVVCFSYTQKAVGLGQEPHGCRQESTRIRSWYKSQVGQYAIPIGSRGRPAPLARTVPARPATPARPRRMAAESSNLKELSRRSDLLPINGLCYCSDYMTRYIIKMYILPK